MLLNVKLQRWTGTVYKQELYVCIYFSDKLIKKIED